MSWSEPELRRARRRAFQQRSLEEILAGAQRNVERAEELMRQADEHARLAEEIRNSIAIPQFSVPRGGLTFYSVPPNPQPQERDAPTMRSRDRDALSIWVDDLRHPLSTRPRRRSRHVDGDRDGLRFRRRPIARVVGNRDKSPVIALTLKRWPRTGAVARLTQLAKAYEIPLLILPEAVQQEAKIERDLIEVVATADKPNTLFAAPDVLFRANLPLPSEERYEDETGRQVRTRWAYFISGFDSNERGVPKWFVCELPPLPTKDVVIERVEAGEEFWDEDKGKWRRHPDKKVKRTIQVPDEDRAPKTLAEAYAMLKPSAVVLAEEAGTRVKRQGDMYAIPMRGVPEGISGKGPRGFLYRSNHRADQVVIVGESVYARGKIVHRPLDRPADHAPLRLGRKWHLIVKNTVPVAK